MAGTQSARTNRPMGSPQVRGEPHKPPCENESPREREEPPKCDGFSPFAFIDGIFGGKKPDTERLILVLLIIILARDGADFKLLIALGYLLI